MTNFTIGRWLLVVLAVIGLAFAVPAVSAHSNGTHENNTVATNAPPYNGTGADWAAWMESHMNQHMGPGSINWMESHMGVSVDEMGHEMAGDSAMNGAGQMNGNGYGC